MRQFILLLVCLVVIDQVSKYFAQQIGIVSLNHGVSFGWLSVVSGTVLTVCLFILLCVVTWMLVHFRYYLGGGLMVGGAVSNLIDRIVFTAVRDWLPVPFFGIRNNIADYAIFCGIFLLILKQFFPYLNKYLLLKITGIFGT